MTYLWRGCEIMQNVLYNIEVADVVRLYRVAPVWADGLCCNRVNGVVTSAATIWLR